MRKSDYDVELAAVDPMARGASAVSGLLNLVALYNGVPMTGSS